MSTNPRVPLIVDPSSEFLDKFMADPRAKSLPPLVANTGKDAQLLISDPNRQLVGIFVNPNVTSPNGISVIRCAHQKRPGTPVFLIQDSQDQLFDSDQLRALGVQKVLIKPLTYEDIAKLVLPSRHLFEGAEVIKSSKFANEPTETSLSIEDKEFKAILADNYLSGSVSFFDLYVRLAEGNYVKILKAGDTFTADRVIKYKQKGMQYFYIRKEAQEQYLRYCDKLTASLLQSPHVPADIKINQTFNQGEEVVRFLQQQGISEASINHAHGFLDNVQTLVKSSGIADNKLIKDFMKNLAAYDHGVSSTLMTSVILKGLRSDYTVLHSVVGLASMFHDIGLYQLPKELHDEDESKMTDEQKKIFRTHPALSSKLLKGIYGISDTCLQIIEQHHMRKGSAGFPSRSGAIIQLQMAEVLGFADEFVNMVRNTKGDSGEEMKKFINSLHSNFSNTIIGAFGNIFHKKFL